MSKSVVMGLIFLLAGCEAEVADSKRNREGLWDAWQACLDAGGVPIESWIGAPAMKRCELLGGGE